MPRLEVGSHRCDSLQTVKALFFSPFANIWEHAFPESLVAEGLAEKHIDIVTVRCGGEYSSFCVAMSAAGLTDADTASKRLRVCAACHKRRDLLDSSLGFRSVLTDAFIRAEDRTFIDEFVAGVDIDHWPSAEHDGVPIGRYAAYEFLLNHKILGTNIPESLFPRYQDQLRNSLATQIAAGRILDQECPDVVLTYNRLYGVNHAFLAVAEQRGITSYSLQGGGHIIHRGETMTLFRESQTQLELLRTPTWSTFQAQPIGSTEVALVTSHLDGLLEASSAFAYSSAFEARDPAELLDRFGIGADERVALIPMSSEDELNAAQLADLLPDLSDRANVFDNQFAWIRFVFSYAAAHPDRKFILRLHPRMFPNKRENVVAPVVALVEELIAEAPSNIIINLPSDDISLYDLMQIIDVVLGYRSSVGAELAAYGIPVVTPANREFFTYPDEINRTAYSTREYVALLDAAFDEGWSLENMRRAYRWYAFLFARIAVDFSDSVSAKPITIRPKKPGLRLWLWRKMVFLVITYGPLVRERLALQSRAHGQHAKNVFFDVVNNRRANLAESAVWPDIASTEEHETTLLTHQLERLCNGAWKGIVHPRSLANRIRHNLNE